MALAGRGSKGARGEIGVALMFSNKLLLVRPAVHLSYDFDILILYCVFYFEAWVFYVSDQLQTKFRPF